jgi:Putative DNA-binding domain
VSSSLAELQRRFHDAVTGDAIPSHALEVVREDGVSQHRRLEVYANAYRIRILDAIAVEYPKIAAALPPEQFAELCRAYLAVHPTSRPSLREAAQHLSSFLAAGGWPKAPPWLADLAALERARTEAFDGPDARPLQRDDLANIPPEEIAFLRLPLVPTGALLQLHSIADEVWSALEADPATKPDLTPGDDTPVAPRTVLVWRRDIIVIHRTLADDEAQVLRALADGASFADACEVLVEHPEPAQRALEIILTALDGAAFAAAEPLLTTQPIPEDPEDLAQR